MAGDADLEKTIMDVFLSKAMYLTDHRWVRRYLTRGLERWENLEQAKRSIEARAAKEAGSRAMDMRIISDALQGL